MELDEMQILWSEMSDQLAQQKKLTNQIIMKMTQDRYSRKFQALFTFEALGAMFCFLLSVILIVNFNKLDNWYLVLSGVFTLVVLMLYPVLILSSLFRLKSLQISDKNYQETLVAFLKAKKRLLKMQKVALYSYVPLMPAGLMVSVKILSNKNFITMEKGMSLYLVLGFTLFIGIWITRWGYNHYKKITDSAEMVLKELEQ